MVFAQSCVLGTSGVEPESLNSFFDTGSHGTAQAGLGLWILPPPPPECWGNKYLTPYLSPPF